MSESQEPQAPPPDLLLGRLVAGKFRIERLLGAGAMGRVYLAEQINLGKQVALKVLHAHMAGDPTLAKRFHREARSAAALSHPNIISIIDFGSDDGVLYIAMELLNGRNLLEVIRKEWPFTTERMVHIVGQILGALDEAHAKGIVHRDLKPENVMLVDVRGEPDFVRVCDFGIAKAATEREGEGGSAITVAGMVCGTPEYMSPEQARGETLDGRTDLYAMSVILYHLVTGEVPFRANSALGVVTKHLTEAPVPPSQKKPGLTVPAALEAVILRGLAKDRVQRFASAVEMKAALFEAVGLRSRSATSLDRMPPTGTPTDGSVGATLPDIALAGTAVAHPSSSQSIRAVGNLDEQAGSRRSSGWIAGVAVLLLAGGAGGWMLLRRTDSPSPTPPALMVTAAPPVVAPPVLPPPPVAAPPVAVPPVAVPPAIAPPVAAEPTAEAHATTSAHHPAASGAHHKPGPASSTPTTSSTPPQTPPPATTKSTPASTTTAPAAGSFAAAFADGEAQFRAGAVEAALARYQEAARLNPRDARTQRQIGKCFNRLGQRDHAQPFFRRYLELAPDATDADFIRAMLDGK